jgi:hypothetical protein
MAADHSLPLDRISQALHRFFDMLSDPETLPEFPAIQVWISNCSLCWLQNIDISAMAAIAAGSRA